jgi:hypothetical protein
MKFNPKHVGSSLEDSLAEFGILEDATNYAVKSVLACILFFRVYRITYLKRNRYFLAAN